MTFRIGEAHHLYWGLLLVLFGVLGGGIVGWGAVAVGAVVALDDIAQHFLGFDPSPLHQLYVRHLWPIPWVQRLNRWVDRVL